MSSAARERPHCRSVKEQDRRHPAVLSTNREVMLGMGSRRGRRPSSPPVYGVVEPCKVRHVVGDSHRSANRLRRAEPCTTTESQEGELMAIKLRPGVRRASAGRVTVIA